ncbi:hypothetical protein KFU94_65880 [Chloroflexi bacterium TSY]|nr:hypothetical protein [Chloroflexi bacterium TSY]
MSLLRFSYRAKYKYTRYHHRYEEIELFQMFQGQIDFEWTVGEESGRNEAGSSSGLPSFTHAALLSKSELRFLRYLLGVVQN